MKYSKLHGNGVYARKALQKGEIVEFAPSVLLMNTEMLGTFGLVSTGLVSRRHFGPTEIIFTDLIGKHPKRKSVGSPPLFQKRLLFEKWHCTSCL